MAPAQVIVIDQCDVNVKVEGMYKLQDKMMSNKPVYYCKRNHLYLYPKYPGHSYLISRKLGGTSYACKFDSDDPRTHTGPIMVWSNKDNDYVEAANMTVTEAPPEEANESVEAFHLKCKYGNIRGGYKITHHVYMNKPVWKNDDNALYILYEGEKWIVTDAPELDENGYSFFMASKETDSHNPVECVWEGATVEEVVEDEDEPDPDEANKFTDADFPPDNSSIGSGEDAPRVPVQWVRGPGIHHGDTPLKLFDRIEPNDMMQGHLGDCWLLAALCAVAEFPKYLEDNTLVEKDVTQDGKYHVRIYDLAKRDWIKITVDDNFPCDVKKWYERQAKPLFAQPHGNEIYVLLIEKAFAKYAGGYTNLVGGCEPYAWQHLTGCENQEWWDFKDGFAEKSVIATDERRKDPRNFQEILVEPLDEKMKLAQFYQYLMKCEQNNNIMGASIDCETEEQRPDGLVAGHAYTIMKVTTAMSHDGAGAFNLIQLRNPWGSSMCWKGKWNDDDDAHWSQVDKDEYVNHHEPEGAFWMSYGDFTKIFTDVTICPVDMGQRPGSHKKVAHMY